MVDFDHLIGNSDPDRPRGILSPADRKFLTGDSDIEPKSHSERRTRERIRERIVNAILDFALINATLKPRDRDLIFEAFDADDSITPSQVFTTFYLPSEKGPQSKAASYQNPAMYQVALYSLVAFMYEGLTERSNHQFEDILEYALTLATYQGEEGAPAPRYSVTIEPTDPARFFAIIETIQKGEIDSLTDEELRFFMKYFSRFDEFQEFYDKLYEQFRLYSRMDVSNERMPDKLLNRFLEEGARR